MCKGCWGCVEGVLGACWGCRGYWSVLCVVGVLPRYCGGIVFSACCLLFVVVNYCSVCVDSLVLGY